MKVRFALLLTPTLLLSASAGEARFFRVAGPVPSTITTINADGYVTWTNTPTNAVFTVQTAASPISPSNWLDYIQVPVTNGITTHRIFDPDPPSGMALVPAGTFTMGNCTATNEGFADELPLHVVYVSAIYMDRFEVTEALWDDVYQWATNRGFSFDNAGAGKAANHPVHTINWYDMVKWCNARSQRDGLSACYYTDPSLATLYVTGLLNLDNASVKWNANGYRLPTEAEWEKAARGGVSGHRFPWADAETITQSRANYLSYWDTGQPYFSYDVNATSGYHPTFATNGTPCTSPVGYFAPNGYELYDMIGNVDEWCWDGYNESWYSNPAATQTNTGGPSGVSIFHVLRGSSWNHNAYSARCAGRNLNYPFSANFNTGFRCVRGP